MMLKDIVPKVGGCFGNNDQALRGYALILTHPGVPCVFHWDYARSSAQTYYDNIIIFFIR